MKVEALIFTIIGFFCVIAAVVYGVWSQEPIGTTALVLAAGLTLLIGGFFWFVSRRIDARPEDRQDAEIAEGAGELGFFPPRSAWPLVLSTTVVLVVLGPVFGWWLMFLGFAFGFVALTGWVYEFYRGDHAH